MKIIKIEEQPTVAGYVAGMKKGDVLRFHISHAKAAREAAGRKMKDADPNSSFKTEINRAEGFIEIVKEA